MVSHFGGIADGGFVVRGGGFWCTDRACAAFRCTIDGESRPVEACGPFEALTPL